MCIACPLAGGYTICHILSLGFSYVSSKYNISLPAPLTSSDQMLGCRERFALPLHGWVVSGGRYCLERNFMTDQAFHQTGITGQSVQKKLLPEVLVVFCSVATAIIFNAVILVVTSDFFFF